MIFSLQPPEKRRLIIETLRERLDEGLNYVRSKEITDWTDISPRSVGANLKHLSDHPPDDMEITAYAMTSSTTWQISKESDDEPE